MTLGKIKAMNLRLQEFPRMEDTRFWLQESLKGFPNVRPPGLPSSQTKSVTPKPFYTPTIHILD